MGIGCGERKRAATINYPQLNKIAKIKAENGFLRLNRLFDWLADQNLVLCEVCEGRTIIEVDPEDISRVFEVALLDGMFIPTHATRQDIILHFCDIDLEEANKELKTLCEKAKDDK